jgi:hypothetical protein
VARSEREARAEIAEVSIAPRNLRSPKLLWSCARSQDSPVMLPLRLQLRQNCDKARILPQIVQVGIVRKEGITRKPVTGRFLQPPERRISLFHERIGRADVICGVMEVNVTPFLFHRPLDGCLRLAFRPAAWPVRWPASRLCLRDHGS